MGLAELSASGPVDAAETAACIYILSMGSGWGVSSHGQVAIGQSNNFHVCAWDEFFNS